MSHVFTFHYKISLLFFCFKFFASLHFSNFRFEVKQSEAKFKSIFSLFSLSFAFFAFFSLFSLFFSLFSLFFALIFLLRFGLVIIASKWSKIQVYFFVFFTFFHFYSLFLLFLFFFAFFTFFRLIFVSLRFFCLIFAYFTFVFASYFWCFASKWIMWNHAFFSLPSETKFSLQFQILLPKRKWGRTLPPTIPKIVSESHHPFTLSLWMPMRYCLWACPSFCPSHSLWSIPITLSLRLTLKHM